MRSSSGLGGAGLKNTTREMVAEGCCASATCGRATSSRRAATSNTMTAGLIPPPDGMGRQALYDAGVRSAKARSARDHTLLLARAQEEGRFQRDPRGVVVMTFMTPLE